MHYTSRVYSPQMSTKRVQNIFVRAEKLPKGMKIDPKELLKRLKKVPSFADNQVSNEYE